MRQNSSNTIVTVFMFIGVGLIGLMVTIALIDAARIGLLTPDWYKTFPEINWSK